MNLVVNWEESLKYKVLLHFSAFKKIGNTRTDNRVVHIKTTSGFEWKLKIETVRGYSVVSLMS